MAATEIITFGCRLNSYESEVMRAHAKTAGVEDAVIINTCAVTAEAERQARQAIRRARRERPGAQIIVTGCAAQIDPGKFAAMPEVDRVIGNREKLAAETYLTPTPEKVSVDDIMVVRETAHHLVPGFEGRVRAFLQVQQGCDHRCSFCIIPFGRGPSQSVPIGAIVEQARTLTAAGYREMVLTGVDITSYGADLPGQPTLGQMIRRLLALVPSLTRLRLSSLDPVEIDQDLRRLILDESRLMPHLHLSIQAGDDLVLKRMKRRHLRADVIALCQEIRTARPDIAFGADMIAGFPTETEAMHQNSLEIIESCDLTWLHVFPYSARVGTPAARMPACDAKTIKRRALALRAAGRRAAERWMLRQVGRTVSILVEQERLGRSPDFAPVVLDRDCPVGSLQNVTLTHCQDGQLHGRLTS